MKSGKTPDSACWETVGAVVQGATHIRQGKICQDALKIYEGAGFAVVCAADGHGSERCAFSDEGAAAAVRAAAEILAGVLEEPDALAALTAQKDIRLPKLIEAKWKEAVRQQYDNAAAADTQPADMPAPRPPFSYELYGTTLLALCAARDFVFALQIGDGDIVAIDADGAARWLMPPDDAPAGNETESLCMDDAWRFFRTQLIPADRSLMYLLATDGYANSFVNNAAFLKVGADIFNLWRENGRGYIAENLPAWLAQTSADGSGDDISVGIIRRKK